jgi:hypothetical protein
MCSRKSTLFLPFAPMHGLPFALPCRSDCGTGSAACGARWPMVDRPALPLRSPLAADLDGVLAAARQRRAEDVGRLTVRAAAFMSLPGQVCRMLVQAWLRHLERRIEVAVSRLDRAGLLEDGAPACQQESRVTQLAARRGWLGTRRNPTGASNMHAQNAASSLDHSSGTSLV